jgi:uncharacterized protein (TIGR03435 family)
MVNCPQALDIPRAFVTDVCRDCTSNRQLGDPRSYNGSGVAPFPKRLPVLMASEDPHMNRPIYSMSGILILAATVASSQTRPSFEVVSIHPSAPFSDEAMRSGLLRSGVKVDGARADFRRQWLIQLICRAYRVELFQVAGPSWLSTEQFDIVAKMPDGASADQVPEMLQTMLEQRFGLALHRENKEFSVYALIVGKDGLKLKRPPGYAPPGSTYGTPGTFDNVIPLLTNALQRPVIDGTGLVGEFDLPLGDLLSSFTGISSVLARMDDATRARAEAAPPDRDTFQVIRTWGLQLEPRKQALTVLVIDHIEKAPTEN